tara:strand:+ start:140 stop:304 length:165 start_codon:yes stop_codon:yes gene_type:complete
MKKLLSIFMMFVLLSCSPNIENNNFEFSDDMTFDEFKLKLEEYSKENPYPNIDN